MQCNIGKQGGRASYKSKHNTVLDWSLLNLKSKEHARHIFIYAQARSSCDLDVMMILRILPTRYLVDLLKKESIYY